MTLYLRIVCLSRCDMFLSWQGTQTVLKRRRNIGWRWSRARGNRLPVGTRCSILKDSYDGEQMLLLAKTSRVNLWSYRPRSYAKSTNAHLHLIPSTAILWLGGQCMALYLPDYSNTSSTQGLCCVQARTEAWIYWLNYLIPGTLNLVWLGW